MRGISKAPSSKSKATIHKRLRTRFGVLAALIAVLALALSAGASADPLGSNSEFFEPDKPTLPFSIAKGSDGNMWFTDPESHLNLTGKKIGRVTPSGEVKVFSPAGMSGGAYGIAEGPDGNVWFTEPKAQKVGYVKPSEPATSLVEFSVPGLPTTTGSARSYIVTGPDGNLWATLGTKGIARITPVGVVTEFTAGLNAGANVCSITAGPDGNVWFGDCGTTKAVGKITPSGTITEFTVAGATGGQADSIALGSDGRLWFPATNAADEKLGAITTEGTVTYYKTPTSPVGLTLNSLTKGPDGNIWAMESAGENESQKVTITATGGTYKLGFEGKETGWTGSGDISGFTATGDVKRAPTSGNAKCNFTSGSKEATLCTTAITELAEVGMRITCGLCSSAVPVKTTITKIEGSTITMSNAAVATGAEKNTTAGWIKNVTFTSGNATVGQQVAGTGLTTSEVIAVGELEGKGTITPATVPTAVGTGIALTGGSKTITNVKTTTGALSNGEVISGSGIPANTTVTAVSGETATISEFPTENGTAVALSADLPYNASTTNIDEALEKLSTVGVGNVSVGTDGGSNRSVAFEGKFTRTDVPQLICDSSKLTGGACSVETTAKAFTNRLFRINTEGKLLPENGLSLKPATRLQTLGKANALASDTSGNIWYTTTEPLTIGKFGTEPASLALKVKKTGTGTGTVTSSPAGINCGSECSAEFENGEEVTLSATPDKGMEFSGWSGGGCSGTGACKVTIEGFEDIEVEANFEEIQGPTNRRTIALTKSPAGNAGQGLGTVSSKPKGIKCAQVCNEATGRFYKGQAVLLTALPSGELSGFKEWKGSVCNESTSLTCTVPAGTEDHEVEAVFKGSSKPFSPAVALTLSKGESELNFGWGTVKASGLTCEAECDETTALYQGPITEPKFKAGKTVELKALAAFGSEFVGWSGACSGTEASCKVEMSEAKSVTAEFADLPDKALTIEKPYSGGLGAVTSKPKGITCSNTCTEASASMPEGAVVELVAKPAKTEPATSFVEWEGGDCDESKSTICKVTMDQAETLKAVFSGPVKAIVEAKSLTLTKEGTGYGTVKAAGLTCEVLCTTATSLYYGPITLPKPKAGAKVTLKATTAPGSTAVTWSGCESNPTPNECVVVMSEAKSVTATFDELEGGS